eukprot:756847_1
MAQSTSRTIVVHGKHDPASKPFEFFVSQSVNELDHKTYDNLINSIASHFNLKNSSSFRYIGQHKHIDNWDDLANVLQNTDGTLHLYITITPNISDAPQQYADAVIDTAAYDHDDNEEDEKNVDELQEGDDLLKWCQINGFAKYYDAFVDEYGMESVNDILESQLDDLIVLCDDANLTQNEKQRLLKLVMTHNDDNELKTWCASIKVAKIYEPLIENGYYIPEQLSTLSKKERNDLCFKMSLKFAAKKRFLKNIPLNEDDIRVDAKDRKIIPVPTNANNENVRNRTILFVGETGTGKTTTINSMMNYLYDADFYGDRYKLIEEKCDAQQATESQTTDISVYYLTPTALDFALTVVDTPGFGNCNENGIEFDKNIFEQLQNLFKGKVTEIDGICFVVKSSETRLTQRQQYVFRQVINVFGDNVADNIILLFTFDDGDDPPKGLQAVNNNKPPIPHRKKYFKFNNNPFKFNLDLTKQHQMHFEQNIEIFAAFFEELTKTDTRSLQLSAEVLRYRETLKSIIQSIQVKLENGLRIHQIIINRINEIRANKDKIDKNDNTLITIQVPESRKVIVKKKKKLWGNLFNDDANYRNDGNDDSKQEQKPEEKALQSFWVCEGCQLTCSYSYIHAQYMCEGCGSYDDSQSITKVKYKYDLVLKDIQVPVRKLDCGYLDTVLDQPRSDRLIEKETERLKEAEKDLCALVVKIKSCINKIKTLALNKDLLTTDNYFDVLISEEQEQCKEGWRNRVKALSSLKKQQDVIAQIEQHIDAQHLELEAIFPEFEAIQLYHKEKEQHQKNRASNIHKKTCVDTKKEEMRPKPNEYREEKYWWWWTIKVFNLTYQDILRNFRGHIIGTDTVDRRHLISKMSSLNCFKLSQQIQYPDDRFKEMHQEDAVVISSKHTTIDGVRWAILLPKTFVARSSAYLVFKMNRSLVDLFEKIASVPRKLFTYGIAHGIAEPIEVHCQMYGSLMTVFDKIWNALQTFKIGKKGSKIRKLYITGSSLGGGLAMLFGYEMIRRHIITKTSMEHCTFKIVVFGAPAVFACNHNTEMTENNNDDKSDPNSLTVAIANTANESTGDLFQKDECKVDLNVSKLIQKYEALHILNSITHCYINRLDPVPRLLYSLQSFPIAMTKVIRGMIDILRPKGPFEVITDVAADAFRMLNGDSPSHTPFERFQMSLEDLKSAKSSYFCIGKQYIFCGKHKKSYCGEEMKVRTQSDIVSTFDKNLIHIIKNIPLTIWKEMFDDHWMDRDGYFSQLRGNITLI